MILKWTRDKDDPIYTAETSTHTYAAIKMEDALSPIYYWKVRITEGLTGHRQAPLDTYNYLADAKAYCQDHADKVAAAIAAKAPEVTCPNCEHTFTPETP